MHAVKVKARIKHQIANRFSLKKNEEWIAFLMKALNGAFFGVLCMLVRQRRGNNGNKSEDLFQRVHFIFPLLTIQFWIRPTKVSNHT
jgi:hypothetical protein